MTTQSHYDPLLSVVKKPGRYIGGEHNSSHSEWDAATLRFALVFPDLYEIGMSHQGLQILYHLLNGRAGVKAERCYAPDLDMEEQLRHHGLPIFSLESRQPLRAFDVIGFTLPYELCYTNILTILDLAGVPLRAAQRSAADPVILGGGSCGLNPEPVADFFDAIVLGDGEEVIIELSDLLLEAKKSGWERRETLERLAQVPGVYVPAFFAPRYVGGELAAVEPLRPGYERVRRRILPRLPAPELSAAPLVPMVKIIHDRLGLEIARGCTRGCRFCQAGIIYRPVREREPAELLKMAEQGIAQGGFHELALLSLSSGDYACLPQLLATLMDRFATEYVSVSLPSMRVGTLSEEIMRQIKRVRKTGFTVAPEAGSDRLRQVINKGITEEDLLATCNQVFRLGWNLIKFYFMVGLPTETLADVEAIIELAQKARLEAGKARLSKVEVNVSVSTFVPKAHTPFQWEAQLSLADSRARIDLLKKMLPRRGFKLKWHNPELSFMEGVFARGDRRLSQLIEEAWRAGARLDGWDENFSLERWQRAATTCQLDLESYLRARRLDEVLPWDHLDSGVERAFFERERQRARELAYTPDCRVHGCQKCGLCDFKTIGPVVLKGENKAAATSEQASGSPLPLPLPVAAGQTIFLYRVRYARTGDGRFLGHLELLQLVFRALSRARIPVLFSQGFNPTPRVSFSPALPVGMESEVEYFDLELAAPLSDLPRTAHQLNAQFPAFLRVSEVTPIQRSHIGKVTADYEVVLPQPLTTAHEEALARFLTQESFVVAHVRKGKHKEVDIRPLVAHIAARGELISLTIISFHGEAGTNPREVLEQVLGLGRDAALLARIKKVRVEETVLRKPAKVTEPSCED